MVRDQRTMLITLIMPVVLLLLFGFAISMEVNNIRVMAIVEQHTDQTREVLERIRVNDYFTYQGTASYSEIEDALRSGRTDAAVILRTDADGTLRSQVIVDASNPTMAQSATAYVQSAIADSGNGSVPIVTQTLYNPQLKSAYNFVPGLMGMIFILICGIMTSVSIVSETETGTMDLLTVSPARPRQVMLGKLVPYFVLSCAILGLILLMAYTVLDLPLSSGIWGVILLTLLYIVLALSIGLLISTLVTTQMAALMVSGMLFMLPVVMLSGMIFPIDNMPVALQWFSCIIPARWYNQAIKVLMIEQLGLDAVVKEFAILGAMTAVIMTLAIMKFKSRR